MLQKHEPGVVLLGQLVDWHQPPQASTDTAALAGIVNVATRPRSARKTAGRHYPLAAALLDSLLPVTEFTMSLFHPFVCIRFARQFLLSELPVCHRALAQHITQ